MAERQIPFLQVDVLTEIGTIGAGRAATSLAELINSKVEINVPHTRMYPFQRLADILGDSKTKYFILDAEIRGDIGGREFFLLSPNEARVLASFLLGTPAEEVNLQDEMVQSSLKEVANILLSSYVNALSELTEFTILVDVPNLTSNIVPADVDSIMALHMPDVSEIIYVRSVLTIKHMNFEGFILFVPTNASLKAIFNKLGLSVS